MTSASPLQSPLQDSAVNILYPRHSDLWSAARKPEIRSFWIEANLRPLSCLETLKVCHLVPEDAPLPLRSTAYLLYSPPPPLLPDVFIVTAFWNSRYTFARMTCERACDRNIPACPEVLFKFRGFSDSDGV